MIELLIIGKIPPPIGGVTIHLNRLLKSNKIKDINFLFFNLNVLNIFSLPFYIIRSQLVHNHSSNPYFRYLIALFCALTNTKLITTFHGNIGRYSWLKNKVDIYTIKMSTIPIVLNKDSYILSKRHNSKVIMLTSFIPPTRNEFDNSAMEKFKHLHGQYLGRIYCTNASAFNYDSNGKEIYSILKLVDIFKKNKDKLLIISDPSMEYSLYFKREAVGLPNNIKVIEGPHSFVNVIKFSDVIIRATTTDGDSISIKEALYLNKKVIASDVTSRPAECIVYNDIEELNDIIQRSEVNLESFEFNENAADDLYCIYLEQIYEK